MRHRHISTQFTAIGVVRDKVMAKVATDATGVERKAIGPATALTPKSSRRGRARAPKERARAFQCGTANVDRGGKGQRGGFQEHATTVASKVTKQHNARTPRKWKSLRLSLIHI